MKNKESIKIIATNRGAGRNYFILEVYESGIVLTGSEVKSVREGKVNLKEGFGRIEEGEAFLHNVHINPYFFAGTPSDPVRKRKLLLHRGELNRLVGTIVGKGLAFIPLKMYLKGGKIKLEMGLAKGKKIHDKRETLKKRESRRDIERAMRTKR